MELIGIDNSKIIALFVAGRADGSPYMPEAVAALVERYQFAEHPAEVKEMVGERIHFGHGVFDGASIGKIDIFSDGVIIEAKTPTEVLDDFLEDVVGWMEPTLGLKRIETHDVSKTYESNIMIRSSFRLLRCLDELEEIRSALADGMKRSTGIAHQFQPAAIGLAADHSEIAGLKPVAFRLERRADIAFSKNFYASLAPLPTKMHMALLSKLEKIST